MADINQGVGQKFIVIGSDGRLLLQSLGATITSIQPVDDKQNIIESAFNTSSNELNLSCENVDTNNANNIILPNTIFQENISNGSESLVNFPILSATLGTSFGNMSASVTSANNQFVPISSKTAENNVNHPIIIQKPVLAPEVNSSCAPLGSQQNPIRIIQQGNNFVPLQNLYPEQLQQIIQAIQDQAKTQEVQQTTTPDQTNIVYNPQTQTKIVYRVVYPAKSSLGGNVKIRPKSKTKKKTTDEIYNFDWDTTISNKMHKEKRKRHRPRTRYGRVSKPPHYMVKDYKHIHPVDYEEDYDDSDGGYSDYTESANEREGSASSSKKHPKETQDEFSYYAGKIRNHKCQVCGKGYIGVAGLNRHLKINPSHGDPNYVEEKDGKDIKIEAVDANKDEYSLDNQLDCSLECQDITSREDGDQSPNHDNEESTNENIELQNDLEVENFKLNENESFTRRVGRKKKSKRGRPPQPANSIQRRKKLLEVVRKSSNIEIIDGMIGYLSKDPNFKFLKLFTSLVRIKHGINKKASIHPKFIISQFNELCSDVGDFLQSYISVDTSLEEEQESFVIADENVVNLLGLPQCGEYWFQSTEVEKEQMLESNSRIKMEPCETDIEAQNNKRKVAVDDTPRKKLKKYLYYGDNSYSNIDVLGEVTSEMNLSNIDNYNEEMNANNEDCFPDNDPSVAAVDSFDHSSENFVDDMAPSVVDNRDNVDSNNDFVLNESQNLIEDCAVLMDEPSLDTLFDGMIAPEKTQPDNSDVAIDDQSNDDDLKAFLPTSQLNSFSSEASLNNNLFACLISLNSQQQSKYIEVTQQSDGNNLELLAPDGNRNVILNGCGVSNDRQLISMELSSGSILPSQNECISSNVNKVSNLIDANSVGQQYEDQIYDAHEESFSGEQLSGNSGQNFESTLNTNDVLVVVAQDESIQIHDVMEQMTMDIVNQCLN